VKIGFDFLKTGVVLFSLIVASGLDTKQAFAQTRTATNKLPIGEPPQQENQPLEPAWLGDTQVARFRQGSTLQIAGNNYRFGEIIGRGGFGVVYEAVDTSTNETVAIKLSPLAVYASTDMKSEHSEKTTEMTSSSFVAFRKQHSELQALIKNLGVERFPFIPRSAEELILDGAYSGNPKLNHEVVRFGVEVMGYSAISLSQKSMDLIDQDASADEYTKSVHRIRLARSVYGSVIKELALLAKVGYGHFDIKPQNIGFDPQTRRFSILDWGGIRKLVNRDQNLMQWSEVSGRFSPPEANNGKHSVASEAFSLGMTLLSILDPMALDKIKKRAPKVLDPTTIDSILRPLQEILKVTGDPQIISDMDMLTQFIKASTVLEISLRRKRLIDLFLPSAFKNRLLEERGLETADRLSLATPLWIRTAADRLRNRRTQNADQQSSLPVVPMCILLFKSN
jgi:serine/threonine protein kinase